VKVIIQWKTVPEDSEHRKVTDRRGVLRSHLKSIKAAAYTVPASALDSLADDPGVFYISADRPLSGKLDNSATAVNAKAVWKAGWIGTGIGVALIDSGIAPGNDLGGGGPGTRIVYSQNFVEDKGNGFDRYGHGTHVAGIIAANGAGL
jgi:serine protease AprX